MSSSPDRVEYTLDGRRFVVPGFWEPPTGYTDYLPEQGLVTLSEAARRSGKSRSYLRRQINEQKLPACRNPYKPQAVWVWWEEVRALPDISL